MSYELKKEIRLIEDPDSTIWHLQEYDQQGATDGIEYIPCRHGMDIYCSAELIYNHTLYYHRGVGYRAGSCGKDEWIGGEIHRVHDAFDRTVTLSLLGFDDEFTAFGIEITKTKRGNESYSFSAQNGLCLLIALNEESFKKFASRIKSEVAIKHIKIGLAEGFYHDKRSEYSEPRKYKILTDEVDRNLDGETHVQTINNTSQNSVTTPPRLGPVKSISFHFHEGGKTASHYSSEKSDDDYQQNDVLETLAKTPSFEETVSSQILHPRNPNHILVTRLLTPLILPLWVIAITLLVMFFQD